MATSNAAHAQSPDAKPASPSDAKDDLKSLPLAEVEKRLSASPDGLTQAEATKRLAKYGPNEIEEKKTNPLLQFLKYFWGPIPWMIEVAVVLSGAVQHWPDFCIILLLLLANATIGFWEERQAGNAIDALKARLAIKARVQRDGKWVTPPAKELVPGDVIRLRLGDIVPADARLLDGDEISVDQSALTGESMPASKKSGDAVFSGSIVRRGEIAALVYATGGKTYFGKTAELVQSAVTVSHFQQAVLRIGNYLIILAVVLVSVIVGLGIYRGEPLLTLLQFALVLTVAAIPVAMPTVLSVTMAVGARLLAKKQAIVSKLVAIEELAGVDVLCADKTGTLTQNKLTLGDPFCLDKIAPDQLILAAALASRSENDDTIDLAVLGGLKDKEALKPFQVTHFQPFDPVHKRTEATVKGKDGKTFKVTKGAPQVIQGLSANAAAVKDAVDKAVNDFAKRGFRALGVARADGDGDWQLLGVLALFDPPRDDAKATVATAAAMGVKIKMVTGDALAIAKETAQTLGMGTNILDGASLGDSKSDETAAEIKSVEDADGFAQVFPEHKYHIVDILQKHDHIVGMTGDGVNDAPALKKADCGFAVSGATDAARSAAAIVLVTPGLSVIIDAIKESRRIFQRMNSYAIYRIAETLRVLIFMTAAIVVFKFYPLTAIMIVMLALLNDGAILSIAYDNVRYRNAPEAWNMRLVLGVATVLGLVGPIAAFGLFYLGDRYFKLGHPQLQTMMYLMLSVAGHLTIFQTRTRGPWWSTRPAWILLGAVGGTQIVATLVAVYGAGLVTPLGWTYAGIVWAYAFGWFLLTDPVKLLAYKVLGTVRADAKPSGQAEPKPDGKAQPQQAAEAGKSDDKPSEQVEPKPDEKAQPPQAAETGKSDDKPSPKTLPETAPKTAPATAVKPAVKPAADDHTAPPSKDAKVRPEPGPSSGVDKAKIATLMDTKLGDVLLAEVLKDPAGAGHLIGQAIDDAESDVVAGSPADKAAMPAAPTRRLLNDRSHMEGEMKIHTEEYRVREGEEVDLKKRPTTVDPVYGSKSRYKEILAKHVEKLSALQQLHYASNRHAVLLIFQAMDAAGKDGAIRHVMSGVNPQGCQVFSFKHPSAMELEHDFLWRTTRDLPERGRIGILNRSYYEEVLVVRVHRDILRGEDLPDVPHHDGQLWHDRYRSINDLERHLHVNGTLVVKIFLHLSKDEQRQRFLARIDEPDKNWKFSTADIEERKFWKQYRTAYEECLSATSTEDSPWYVVPADDKENARLIVSQIVVDTLEGIGMSYPKVSVERARELQSIRDGLVG